MGRTVAAVTIRPATPADAARWAQLRDELWPAAPEQHARDIAAFFAGVRRHGLEAALIAVGDDGTPIGFVELSVRSYAEGCDTDRVGYLEGWFVAAEHRQAGVGRALVRAAEDWARAQGCTEFASGAELTNVISASAHEALGFAEVERQIHYRKDL
jgi:aminoglycoside 6'-N-acetyltransferase I